MRQAPLLNVLLLFVAGIVSTFYFPLALSVAATVAAIALVAMVVLTFVRPLHNVPHSLFQIALALFFVSMGVVTVQLRDPLTNPNHYFHHTEADATYRMQLRLVETPVERNYSYRVTAEMLQIGNSRDSVATQGRIMLYLPKDSLSATLQYGDLLVAQARLSLPTGATNPCQFNYRSYLRRKGIVCQCRVRSGDFRLAGHESGGLPGWSKRLQRHFLERLSNSPLTPSQCGIAEALLLGWRNDLDEATQDQFRDAGIMHLLCVSGLHVGIVAALIGLACRPLFRRKQWITRMLQLAGICFFVLITGMVPATLRAGIMFSFLVASQLLGRNNNSYNTLAAAALVMLCVRPTWVADIGFQLSFSSMFGIVLLYRPFCSLIPFKRRPSSASLASMSRQIACRIWQLACLSMAAQLGALPFTLYHFHQFPVWFLIANITVVPAAGLLVATTLLLVSTTPLPVAAQGVGWLLRQELGAVDALTRWIQRLPGALVDHIYCDGVVATMVAATVAALAWLLHRRDKRWIPLPLLCLVVLLCYWLHVERTADTQLRWIVYDIPHHTAIEFFDGHNSILLVDEELYADPTRMDYVSDNLLTHLRIHHRVVLPCDTDIDSPVLQVNNGTILFYGRRLEPRNTPCGQLFSL